MTSSSSSDGVSPVASSIPATECARSPEWSCEGDRLIATRTPSPDNSQARACRQAVSITQFPIRSDKAELLTTGMNSPGET